MRMDKKTDNQRRNARAQASKQHARFKELRAEHERLMKLVGHFEAEEGELPACRAYAGQMIRMRVLRQRPIYVTSNGRVKVDHWVRVPDSEFEGEPE